MYTKPELIHSIFWTSEREVLPEIRKLFWLGSGYVLVVSPKEAWYLIDVQSGKVILVRWSAPPSRIEREQVLGDSGIIPNDRVVRLVNYYLRGFPDEVDDRSHVSIVCLQENLQSCANTLFREDDAVKYALTAWYLEQDSEDVIVKAWKISLNGEEIGTFISHRKPLVVFGSEICDYKWFILVDKWDGGIDVYQICDKEMMTSR
jgi:hypothetical protein